MKKFLAAALTITVLLMSGCRGNNKAAPLEIVISSQAEGSDTEIIDNNDDEPNSGYDFSKEEKEPEYVNFFKETAVHTIDFQMPASDWDYFINHPLAKTYRTVDVVIDGEMYENAGIRTRGNTSLFAYIDYTKMRPPFEIKFDKYIKDRTFMGLDELSLLNVVDDRAFLREYIGYEAFRAIDSFAPYVTFFNITVNGKLHGLYVGVESVDSSFLERVFNSHKHNLYKSETQTTLLPTMSKSAITQQKGSDESRADLNYLIKTLDKMKLGEKENIEDILDVDSVLKYLAVNAVLHNWDDYAGYYAHNFYMYVNDGKFYFIPWDMNEVCLQWQRHYDPSDGSRQDIASPITGDISVSQRPLVNKLLAVNEYYNKYLNYCEQLNEWLKGIDESGWLIDMRDMLDEYVKNDPTKFYDYSSFTYQFNKAIRNGLSYFIHDRWVYLTKRLEQIRLANKNPITGAELIANN